MPEWISVIMIALPAVCLIFLFILLSGLGGLRRRMSETEKRQAELSEALNAYFREINANGSVPSVLSEIGRSQSALLESMQRTLRDSSQAQSEHASRQTDNLNARLTALDERMDRLRESVTASHAEFRQEVDTSLREIRGTVDEKLSEHLQKRLDASFSQVSERLESVYKGLGEMQTLAAGVGDLKKVLTNVKTRGIWGEMQLGALIRQMLSPGQYDENVAVVPGSSERVEYAILLPDKTGGRVYLPVDSKFPQESYIRLTEASQAGDAQAAEAARKELLQSIRTEAKRISGKYVSPPHTTDFAIMFLPIEGLYSEVLQSPETVEQLQREQRVVIAGPGTFSAILNAFQLGFRTLSIEKRTDEIYRLLAEIQKDFNRFAELLETTRRRLDQAGETIESAVNRTRTIRRKLSAVELPPDEGGTADTPTGASEPQTIN